MKIWAQERKDLAFTLKDTKTIVGKLETIIGFALHFIFIIFYLMVFSVRSASTALGYEHTQTDLGSSLQLLCAVSDAVKWEYSLVCHASAHAAVSGRCTGHRLFPLCKGEGDVVEWSLCIQQPVSNGLNKNCVIDGRRNCPLSDPETFI